MVFCRFASLFAASALLALASTSSADDSAFVIRGSAVIPPVVNVAEVDTLSQQQVIDIEFTFLEDEFFASVQAQDQLEVADLEPTVAGCELVNFQTKSADFKGINDLIKIANGSGLLKQMLKKFDPLVFENIELIGIPFSALGAQFTATPIIKKLDITGLSSVAPRALNVTSETSLKIGTDLKEELKAAGVITVKLQQNRDIPVVPCYTDLNQVRCNPLYIDIDVAVGVLRPVYAAETLLEMLQCAAPGSSGSAAVCKDLLVSDLISAALTGKLDVALARLLKRVKKLNVEQVELGFDALSTLDLNVRGTGDIVRALFKLITKVPIAEINKKEKAYEVIIKVFQALVKVLANAVVFVKGNPSFGNTCFD